MNDAIRIVAIGLLVTVPGVLYQLALGEWGWMLSWGAVWAIWFTTVLRERV